MTRILISGAGIAGSTLAYWLAERGFETTVVELGDSMRSSGSPVDVRGAAYQVAGQMGVLPALKAVATQATTLSFLTADGHRVGSMKVSNREGEVEVPRGDLAAVLYGASRDRAEFLFGDSIADLMQEADGINVSFEKASPRRFDVVVGADGLHSAVRRLAFGPEGDFIKHLGIYVATLPLGILADDPREILMYNSPGKAVSIHPGRGKALAAFIFRSPARPGFDHRDMAQHKRFLHEAFDGARWRVPELLERVDATDDLFFDSVSKVVLPQWSSGRVALLGDAASCVSLFGDGSSLAMIGASTLARALAAHPDNYRAAFAQYEQAHRKLVMPKQRYVSAASRLLIPASRSGLALRDLGVRLIPRTAA